MKKKAIKELNQLPKEIQLQIEEHYPDGWGDNLISFVNAKQETIKALPFETEDTSYLVKVPVDYFDDLEDEEDDELEDIEEVKDEEAEAEMLSDNEEEHSYADAEEAYDEEE